jgi:hypothetical protein
MKIKTKLIKLLTLLLVISIFSTSLIGCGGDEAPAGDATKLSFKAALEYDYLKGLDGNQVSINGYMATSSPVDGSFMFLMNLPYQSCPFCVPNTSQLSNTMEIYPKKGDSFTYTTQAIKVVGTLAVSESEDKPFTDKYGYEFNFKIVDATYTIIKAEDLSADMALWQKIASSDVVTDLYKMYDYVNFLCKWNTYYVRSYVNADGETVPGYYLYPSDAKNYIYPDGAQFNYGYKDGYFDSIISKIEAVDKTAFADLVANVRKAEALAKKALSELENGNYTSEYMYIEMFGTSDYVYTLNIGQELQSEMDTIYKEFSIWLGSWEM